MLCAKSLLGLAWQPHEDSFLWRSHWPAPSWVWREGCTPRWNVAFSGNVSHQKMVLPADVEAGVGERHILPRNVSLTPAIPWVSQREVTHHWRITRAPCAEEVREHRTLQVSWVIRVSLPRSFFCIPCSSSCWSSFLSARPTALPCCLLTCLARPSRESLWRALPRDRAVLASRLDLVSAPLSGRGSCAIFSGKPLQPCCMEAGGSGSGHP